MILTSTQNTDTANLIGTGLTTVLNGSMHILVGGLWAWINSVSAPAGMNERVDNTVIYLADQSIASASATGNKTGTISGSDHWSAFLIALKPEPTMFIPATASVVDDWSSGSIDTDVWDDWGGLRTSVEEKQVAITSTTGSGFYGMHSGASNASQDLTGSFVSNELVSAGNQSLSSFQAFPVYLHKHGDNTNQLEFLVSNNTVYAKKKVAGSLTTIHSASYNAELHKYFRIREASGTIYYDTSVDGRTWTNFTSTASPFDVTKVVVGQMAGTWQTEGSTTSAVFDNFNVETPIMTYDANGNMLSDGENKCYEYNEANELTRVAQCNNDETIAEYIYDYKGQRLVKKNYSSGSLANTVISWHKGFETKDIVGGSIETTNYFYANNELVAKKKPNGDKRYYHSDHLGSTTIITDQSGDLVEETEFDPWGMVLSGGTESKYQYTGQEKDAETGLNYYGARYYDPELKRFTQPDEIIQNVYDPQMLNRYSYVRNNPLKYTDPTGEIVFIPVVLAVVRIVAVAAPIVQKIINNPTVQKTVNNVVNTVKNPSTVVNAVTSGVNKAVDAGRNLVSSVAQKVTGGGGAGGGNAGGGNISTPTEQISKLVPQAPKVNDPKLQNLINKNYYKGASNPMRIGSGSTADAIRNEVKTGQQTFGKWHETQGRDNLNSINKWLKNNPNASEDDIKVANIIKDDTIDALLEINKVK